MRYFSNSNVYFLERMGTHAVTISVLSYKRTQVFVNTCT